LISGTGRNAIHIVRVGPTTMIFVSCAGGISHNEAESTSFDECAAGAQVLLNAVLEFDRRLG
jgi:N-carbamoyl-L-amino-acid hydrolase